jgi:hypothetical protein
MFQVGDSVRLRKIGALGADLSGSLLKLYFYEDADLCPSSGQPYRSKEYVQPSYWCQITYFTYGAKLLRVDYVFVDEHNRHKRLKGTHPRPSWNADPC